MNSNFTRTLRWILGLILLIFGANKLFRFIQFEHANSTAAHFMEELGATGYILPVLGFIEVGVALLLMFKKWVPLSLIILFPVTLNILLYHLFLEQSGLWLAILVLILNVGLMYQYKTAYRPLFAYSY